MMTFSLNKTSGSDEHAMRVLETINRNLGYFKKFNASRWEEAVHRTYITALEHRNDTYSDVLPYIKKLARTVLKVRQTETPFGVYDEEGEISPVYFSLVDYIDDERVDDYTPIKESFMELYLLDPENFSKLAGVFKYEDTIPKDVLKDLKIRNETLIREFKRLVFWYGADMVFMALWEFFKELPHLCSERKNSIKEILLKEGKPLYLNKISDIPTIRDAEGSFYYIDKNLLQMVKVGGKERNPDYFKWDIIGNTVSDILKLDISEFMAYIYEEVFVDMGCNTKHITWCGHKYRLTTPGGVAYIGLELDKFIEVVRKELVMNLLANNLGYIVAISPDNIYFKPSRVFNYNTLRLRFKTGKVMDLPVTVHISKRKQKLA